MTWTPERQREYAREWEQRNREKVREQKARYYQENRERLIEYQRERYRRNRDVINAKQRAYRKRTHDARLATEMFARHGLRPADWAALWNAQEGKCYLCDEPMTPDDERIVIDHDHSHCGDRKTCQICRRGLTHAQCNVAIGSAGENPGRLRRMADALEAAQLAFAQRLAAAGPGQLTLSD